MRSSIQAKSIRGLKSKYDQSLTFSRMCLLMAWICSGLDVTVACRHGPVCASLSFFMGWKGAHPRCSMRFNLFSAQAPELGGRCQVVFTKYIIIELESGKDRYGLALARMMIVQKQKVQVDGADSYAKFLHNCFGRGQPRMSMFVYFERKSSPWPNAKINDSVTVLLLKKLKIRVIFFKRSSGVFTLQNWPLKRNAGLGVNSRVLTILLIQSSNSGIRQRGCY